MWWAREVNPISGDCFASSAIRCCRVDTVSGFDAPAMFPSNDSATRHSLPSPGSPRCQFPCFHGTMECSDVLRPSHRTRLPSPGDTMRRGLCVCSQRSRSPDRGPGVRHPVPSTGNGAHGGVQDLPGSWGTLMLLCRVLRPRRDRCVRRLDVIGAAPAMSTTKAPTTTYLSGLNGTASELAVYASCGRLPEPARNTRFRLLANSAGWDWLPTGFQRKVSALYPYIASPFPKLCLAQGHLRPRVSWPCRGRQMLLRPYSSRHPAAFATMRRSARGPGMTNGM